MKKASFSQAASFWYGDIRNRLEKEETSVGANDLMIASIVLADNGILVIHNTGEFGRIPELQVEDWTI